MAGEALWAGPTDDPERYRLWHVVGGGGEGRVFRATRTVGDRDVDVAMVKEAFGQILGLSSVPKDHGGEHPTSSPNSL